MVLKRNSALAALVIAVMLGITGPVYGQSAAMTLKTESFDCDPGWTGVNHRIAQTFPPRTLRQDFGFSSQTQHAGGDAPGEIGGLVTAAGEAAFYGKTIHVITLDQPLTASGTLSLGVGSTNLLLGFFNSQTVNEWRTPNTIALRLNGRGEKFFGYVEYCTAKWRAGGDTTPFPSIVDSETGRWNLIGFPANKSLSWTLTYDPQGNGGQGVVTATIGDATAVCNLDESHKADGAMFDRFGILSVIKSADSGSEIWLDDVSINRGPVDSFQSDPAWDGRNNRKAYESRIVRPWFDFGFSETNLAGGNAKGELGGCIFRGDCRYAERLACYGDRVGPLTLDKPLTAFGKIALTRGVTDSTVLFGFYNSVQSLRQNDSQSDGIPESTLGIHIEGPSRDGFRFYPVLRRMGTGGQAAAVRDFPTIHPDGKSHDWRLDYDPAAGDHGRITVTLDSQSGQWDLPAAESGNNPATTFDCFGIVTSWIDGNSQDVYWDDITYTHKQR